jgi:hypothetical protein
MVAFDPNKLPLTCTTIESVLDWAITVLTETTSAQVIIQPGTTVRAAFKDSITTAGGQEYTYIQAYLPKKTNYRSQALLPWQVPTHLNLDASGNEVTINPTVISPFLRP